MKLLLIAFPINTRSFAYLCKQKHKNILHCLKEESVHLSKLEVCFLQTLYNFPSRIDFILT